MELYTVKETAQRLRVCEQSVREWIHNGLLPATINSRQEGYRIREDDLYLFMDSDDRYKIYSYDSDTRRMNKNHVTHLQKILSTLYQTRESLNQDINNIEAIIASLES